MKEIQKRGDLMAQPIKIDIIAGFLGSGKTTLINKLLKEAYFGEKIAVLENEFGAVGVDGSLIERDDVNITEMSGGCICCSLKGTLTSGLVTIAKEYAPSRILIEPTGLADITDIAIPIADAAKEYPMEIDRVITVLNGKTILDQLNSGVGLVQEQIRHSSLAVLSRSESCNPREVIRRVHEIKDDLTVVSASWDKINGLLLLDLADHAGVHHIADEHGNCSCGCCHDDHDHEGHHHHHHSADDYGYFCTETEKVFSEADLAALQEHLQSKTGGDICRAKGILKGGFRFDYVEGEFTLSSFAEPEIGKCVFIGKQVDETFWNHFVKK
ncbi:MAG: hypothetical protein IJO94_06710 [Firmicutes bacterium]|nr:hypothetical protein [Bacillota bacterium]